MGDFIAARMSIRNDDLFFLFVVFELDKSVAPVGQSALLLKRYLVVHLSRTSYSQLLMLTGVEDKLIISICYLLCAVFFDDPQAVVGLPDKRTDLHKGLGYTFLLAALDSVNRFKDLFMLACFAVISDEKSPDAVKSTAEEKIEEKSDYNNCSDHNTADDK